MKGICDLTHCSESVLGIILPSMHQKTNVVDCGLFAVAFPVDILNEFAEVGKRFDVRKMRLYLLKCLEEDELILFPESDKHTKLS